MTNLCVTHVISGLETGGAEMMLLKLVAATSGRIQHTVISLRDHGTLGEGLERLGAHVDQLDIKADIGAVAGLARLSGLIAKSKPSVTQGWMYHGNTALALTRLVRRVSHKMLWSIRCTVDEGRGEKALTRIVRNCGALLSRQSSVTIYNSERSKSQHEALGYASNGIVIGNGFDLERFHTNAETKQIARASLGLPSSDPIVLMIAREDPMKDYENFLSSAALLNHERRDVTFVAVGRGVPELSKRSPACDAAIRNLGAKLRLFPELADVVPVLRAADVFVLSSAWGEAFPNVLGEAMASGVPCVATDVGDCKEIIGDAGLVVAPRSPSMLAANVLSLLSKPDSDRLEIGLRARKRIGDRYSIEAIARKYESIWQRMAGPVLTRSDRVT